MTKSIRMLAVWALSMSLLPFAAHSQESDDEAASEPGREMTREQRRAAWENLSEEQKQAKREQMRARREQRRAQWESMSPEQREAMRERRMQRRHRGKRGKRSPATTQVTE